MNVLTHDFEDIIKDDEVKIVAEVMGGLHPAYEFTKRCLEAGKSVCTSNKELVAEHEMCIRDSYSSGILKCARRQGRPCRNG